MALETTWDLDAVPKVARRKPPALSNAWRWFAGLVGPVVLVIGRAIEPAPQDPAAAAPLLAVLAFFAVLWSFYVAAQLAWERDREALFAAAVGTGGLLAMTVACPSTGHHAVAGWWFGQLALSGGALALSLLGRRLHR